MGVCHHLQAEQRVIISSNASIVRVLGHPPQIQTIYSAFMFEASSHKFWNRAVER